MTTLGDCDCCGSEAAVGVAAVPFVPISIAWGRFCLEAEVIPYWIAVTNTAMCGGLEETNEDWRGFVERTLAYFGKSQEEFTAEVAETILEMDSSPTA